MFRSKREQKSEASLPEVFDVGLYHALMSALSVQVDDSETSTMPEDGVVSESFQR